MRVQLDPLEVGDRDRTALQAARPTRVVVEVDADRREPFDHVGVGAVDAARPGSTVPLVVLHDRAAVGPGELDRVHGDGRQHVVDVEARAHRLADLAQRLELLDLAGELGAARLELPARA